MWLSTTRISGSSARSVRCKMSCLSGCSLLPVRPKSQASSAPVGVGRRVSSSPCTERWLFRMGAPPSSVTVWQVRCCIMHRRGSQVQPMGEPVASRMVSASTLPLSVST